MGRQKNNQAAKEPVVQNEPALTMPESSGMDQIEIAVPSTSNLNPNTTVQSATSGTIFVAMNYPQSLKFSVPDRSGLPRDIVLNGNAVELRGKEMGILPVGAYGITEIDTDAWSHIKTHYAGLPLIKNGLIFAMERNESFVKDAAAERNGERNGFEPVDPNRTNTKPDDSKEM